MLVVPRGDDDEHPDGTTARFHNMLQLQGLRSQSCRILLTNHMCSIRHTDQSSPGGALLVASAACGCACQVGPWQLGSTMPSWPLSPTAPCLLQLASPPVLTNPKSLLGAAQGPWSPAVLCLLLPCCPLHQQSPACCSYSVLRKDKYKFNLKQHLEQEAKKHGRTLPSGVSCTSSQLGHWDY